MKLRSRTRGATTKPEVADNSNAGNGQEKEDKSSESDSGSGGKLSPKEEEAVNKKSKDEARKTQPRTKGTIKKETSAKAAKKSDSKATGRRKMSSTTEEPKKPEISAEVRELIEKIKQSNPSKTQETKERYKQLDKDLKNTFNQHKRDIEESERRRSVIKPSKTRSGKRRGSRTHQPLYTSGLFNDLGMKDSEKELDEETMKTLETKVNNFKSIDQLKPEHIHYLVAHKLLDDLKRIQAGELKSDFHDRYSELDDKNELRSEVRATLFTNEQRDYLSGLLQGLFDANKVDSNGDIPYNLINYVNIVIFQEAVVRLVKYVHGFSSVEETLSFMKEKSKEYFSMDL